MYTSVLVFRLLQSQDVLQSPAASLPDHYYPPAQCERYEDLIGSAFPMLEKLGVKASLQPILLFKIARIGREFFEEVS